MTPEDIYNTPEKKYVRNKWLEAANNRKSLNNVEFINYCTFPGKECYDVLLLKSLLKTTKTGYDEGTITFFEKDPEILTDIRNILPGARFYKGYFEDFVEAAWQNRSVQPDENSEEINPFDYFPYDVVNLDFTGPGFKHNGEKISPEMNSIATLFEIQSFKHKSFSLFLTFPAIKSSNDEDGRQELNEAIKSVLQDQNNDVFKTKFDNLHPNITSPYYFTRGHVGMEYKDFLLIGIPIIIINFGFTNKFDVKCTKRFSYIGTGNRALMVTFIFECEYLESRDYQGSEIQVSRQLRPQRLSEIFDHYEDINQLFERNSDLRQRYSYFLFFNNDYSIMNENKLCSLV